MSQNSPYALFSAVAPALKQCLPVAEVDDMAAQLQQAEKNNKPAVMFYGLYNAGKSTLINALIGEEQAANGRVPTTSQVTAYPWQNIELLDTPGIDAPPEHEQITEAQLKQSDIVIMVLHSRGATQELESYRTILRLLAQGQQVLVVVNSFDAQALTDSDTIAITDDILATLQRLASAGEQPLLEQIQVLWVNAQSGLAAKQTQKPALLNASGLPLLEQTLQRMIKHTGKAELQRRQAGLVMPLLALAEQQLAGRLQDTEAGQIIRLQGRLDEQRQQAEGRLLQLIEQQRRLLKTSLMVAIKQPDTIEPELNRINERLATELEQALHQQLAGLGEEFATLAREFSPSTVILEGFEPLPVTAGTVVNLPELSGMLQGLSKEQVQQAIELAQRMLPRLFGEFNRKAAEKMADGVTRFNPLLMALKEVVFGVWNYYQERRQAEAAEQQLIRYHQQLRDVVEQTANDYAHRAGEAVHNCMDMAFSGVSEQLAAQHQAWQQQNKQAAEDQQHIRRLRLQLQSQITPEPSLTQEQA